MPFRDVIEPTQLAILTSVLDDICRAAGIPPHSPEREDIGALIVHFFGRGYRDADELKDALDTAMRWKRYG